MLLSRLSEGRRDRAESRSRGTGKAFERCRPHGLLVRGSRGSLAGKATARGVGVFQAGERERCWSEEKNGHQAQEETMTPIVSESVLGIVSNVSIYWNVELFLFRYIVLSVLCPASPVLFMQILTEILKLQSIIYRDRIDDVVCSFIGIVSTVIRFRYRYLTLVRVLDAT